jgi:hypothetical protein
VTNLDTNQTEWHQDTTWRAGGMHGLQGPESSEVIGNYDPKTKKFTPTDNALATQKAYFTSPAGTKEVADNIIKTNKKSLIENGLSPAEAEKKARDISNNKPAPSTKTGENGDTTTGDTTTGDTTTGDTATDEDVGTQDTAQLKEVNPGTKKDFGKNLTYPSTLDLKNQDTIQFSMLEYAPKALTSSGGMLGSGNRADRKSIGSVILPIPNGIKDADKVSWGEDSMDAGALALAAIAFSVIAEGEANDELKKIQAGIRGVSGTDATNAIASHFTGAAIGKDKGKFMSRATGQVMNPNMELLFNGPSLRDFSFTFLLAPRDHQEAMTVM